MNYCLKLRMYLATLALSLIVLSAWAAEGPVTVSSLHERISRYIEDPWYYANEAAGVSWIALYNNTISDQIIPYGELSAALNAANNALAENLRNDEYWFGRSDPTNYVQHAIVPADAAIAVFSDIHGSAHSLLRSLHYLMTQGYLNDDFTFKDPKFYLVFLGDCVDRGIFTPEVLYILMKLKLASPSNVFLLRGNHDTDTGDIWPTNWKEGMQSRYSYEAGDLIARFAQFFSNLPQALYLGTRNGKGGIDYMIFAHAGVNADVDSHDFLLAQDSVYSYAGDARAVYGEWPPRSPYMWTYITKEKVGSESNHVLTVDEVNRWLSRMSREGVCVHALIRGHQHGGRDYDPQLEEGQGYAAYENIHTISSGAGAGGVFLPYDSFLLLHTAADFSAWNGVHVFRKVGYSLAEINIFGAQLFEWLQVRYPRLNDFAGLGRLFKRLGPDVKTSVLGELARELKQPLSPDSLYIDEHVSWTSEPIVLSSGSCIAKEVGGPV